jgi:hypothetical protein
MIPVERIKDGVIASGLAIALLVVLCAAFARQAIGWLLMKLYQFFIGSKSHVSPD